MQQDEQTTPRPSARQRTSAQVECTRSRPAKESSPLTVRPRWFHAFAALVLCGMFALSLLGHRDDSPTEDEWAHTTRGIAYWQQSDTRLHYSHPPLANAISGLPLAGDPSNPDLAATAAWKQADVGRVALEYLKDDYAAARARLMRARVAAMLGFGVLLAAYTYFFCWTMFGPTTAVEIGRAHV